MDWISKKSHLFVVMALAIGLCQLGCGSGCGSNEGAAGDTEAPLAKAEFVKQANEICAGRLEEKDRMVGKALQRYAASRNAGGGEPPHAAQEMVQAIVVPFEGIATELAELPVTGKNEIVAQEMISKLEKGLAKAEADRRAFILGRPFAEAAAVAEANGIKGCSFGKIGV